MEKQIESGDLVIFNNDNWNDLGKTYVVEDIRYRDNSTAVDLIIDGHKITVPGQWLERVKK